MRRSGHGAARAYWLTAPGKGELRTVPLTPPAADEVLVRTRYSAISRGTESLVFRGGVPESEHARMRAPFQVGAFPAPVEYGYLNVGVVEQGPPELLGRTVFCLYPHQTRYVVPAAAVTPVPDGVPARRAVLAGMVETALNALWDAPPLIGDRVAVVGGGTLGCCVAHLAARVPATQVTLIDIDPARAGIAAGLGAGFALPDAAPQGCDLAFHASATATGLATALATLGFEGELIELSWYGDQRVSLPIGGAFHSQRLVIRASQVGRVAAARRARRSNHQRLALALELLRDPAFDALLASTSPFAELPATMARLGAGTLPPLCHVISYAAELE